MGERMVEGREEEESDTEELLKNYPDSQPPLQTFHGKPRIHQNRESV